MAALTDLSDALNKLTGGASGTPEAIFPFKDGRVGSAAAVTVAGRFSSLWQYNGARPTHGDPPGGTARNPTRATNGAVGQADPGGGRQKWLTAMHAMGTTALGTLIMFDRLADISGLVGNVNTPQSITGLSVTRYTGAESAGNEIWVEIFSAIGSTATTISASYTNQDGTAGRTTQLTAIGGTGLQEVQRFIRLPLQQGDTGVRSVESITLTATTGTAGDIGVVIARRLAIANIYGVGLGIVRDFITGHPGPPEIKTGAALFFAWLAASTTPPQLDLGLQFVES
jgi:hypothetical protein